MPAPAVALNYYNEANAYLFDEFQTARVPGSRKPSIANLYDVFQNIRDDEAARNLPNPCCSNNSTTCTARTTCTAPTTRPSLDVTPQCGAGDARILKPAARTLRQYALGRALCEPIALLCSPSRLAVRAG